MSLKNLTEKDRRRFEKRLRRNEETGCVEFMGYRDKRGYGRFGVRRRIYLAHRVAFVLAGHFLGEAESLRHACDNPSCCDPGHLSVGGQDKNMSDMAKRGRGRKSRYGLPYGVKRTPEGRFQARYQVPGLKGLRYIGAFDFWQEAAALAMYRKNLELYPDFSAN